VDVQFGHDALRHLGADAVEALERALRWGLDLRCARGGWRCCTYFDERRLREAETVDKHLTLVSASSLP
jgi:hypothetical protein